MKINKDLVDAVMMISFISLVLVGTTDFDSAVAKDAVMALLGLLTLGMAVLRGIQMKQAAKEPKDDEF